MNKEIKNYVNKFKKRLIICIGVAIIIIFALIFFIQNADKSAIKVCESSIDYNKGIGLTFYIGKDGETIEKIEKNDTVSLNFIKKNLAEDISDKDSRAILNEYKKNVKFLYDNTVKKYKDLKWFHAKLDEKGDMITTIYTFDVSDASFDYDKYKNLLQEFSLEYYYDSAKRAFIYNESLYLSDKTPLGNIENVECHAPDIKVKKAS